MKTFKAHYENKRVLVTGGAGFIGSNLVKELVSIQAKVTVLDNFSSGTEKNLSSVINAIELIEGNICNTELCDSITQSKDIIFHLAAMVSVPLSINDPETCYRVNVQGTENLLKAACNNAVMQFVFSSSSAVYGNQSQLCKETIMPAPQSPYAESKLISETLCKKYTYLHSLSTSCLRYFNVYGKDQNPNGEYAAVVARFTEALLHKKPITIYGDGLQTRDFIPVESVINANLLLGMHQTAECLVVNIASGKSITLLELISQLENKLHTKAVEIIFTNARSGDIINSVADCSYYSELTQHLLSSVNQ